MSGRRLLRRLFNAMHPGRGERDLAREIDAHLALLEDDFQRRGMSADDARAAARRALGSTAHAGDLHRDARSFVWLDDLRWDMGYAARLLRRNPLFTLTAAASLAIGIGANTTIFSVANALLFRDPPGVTEPDRLVDIGRSVRRGNAFNPGSYPDYLDIRRRTTTLEGVFALPMFPRAMSLATADAGGAERIVVTPVTMNYFTALGVRPAAGRLFEASDSEQPGASPIVVLSHRFWTRRFNQHPRVVGQIVRVNERPFTVVGVAPEGFQGTGVRSPEAWIPITMTANAEGPSVFTSRAAAVVIMGARLKPGVSVSQAAAEVDAIGKALARDYPEDDGGKGLRLLGSSPVPGNSGPIAVFLGLLMGIVSIVLVVACANLAGVLLARAAARRREIAVRLAIGAGRARLIRQLLTETLMLFAIGGAGGLLLARGMTSVLSLLLPSLPFPIDVNLALDGRVIAFTTALSLVASLACGLAPALQASRPEVVSTLKDDAQGPADGSRLRHAFLVAQVALSIVLVVIAGLFARALQRVSASDPGFDPHGVELASVDLTVAGYTDKTAPAFARALIERVRQLPDVQSATIAATLPGGFERMSLAGIAVPGVTTSDGQRLFFGDWNIVEPGYFSTLRMPLIAGRDFTNADVAGAPPVAIIGVGAARRFWPGQDAVGKQIVQEVPGPPSAIAKPAKTLLVVGMAQDPTYGTLIDNTTGVYIYVPLQQQYHAGFTTIVARSTHGQPLANTLRAAVASMNPNLPIANAQSAEDYTSLGLLPQRIAASVAGSLGLVGLLLAAVGIYGVTAYAVTRRTREFGVRIALGATRGDIVGMVLRHGLGLAAAGSAIGLLLAAAASRLLTSFLFGVTPIDPVTFTSAALLFALVGLAACYVPARRATRIDAMEALRYE